MLHFMKALFPYMENVLQHTIPKHCGKIEAQLKFETVAPQIHASSKLGGEKKKPNHKPKLPNSHSPTEH